MTVIASGDNIALRDRMPSDVDRFIYWQTHGEWRLFDAPWEGEHTTLTEEREADIRSQFLRLCAEVLPSPRQSVIIATKNSRPIGWINRHVEERTPDTWTVGIDICEDEMLNKGLGTEALGLWVDYLFTNSNVHRIGLDTWSFNPRMQYVAEKAGFIAEGIQREVIKWNGQWCDKVHFSILRPEWEDKRKIVD
ncbi:GNAT family N-acetyltransferase [Chloroflexota bacterium]